MAVVVEVLGSDQPGAELESLRAFLRTDPELRAVDVARRMRAKGAGTMSADLVALVLTAAAGGAGTALARALLAWVNTRVDSIRVSVTNGERRMELDIRHVRDPATVAELVRLLQEPAGE